MSNNQPSPILVAQHRPNNTPIVYLHCNQCRKMIMRLTDITTNILTNRHYFCHPCNPEQREFNKKG